MSTIKTKQAVVNWPAMINTVIVGNLNAHNPESAKIWMDNFFWISDKLMTDKFQHLKTGQAQLSKILTHFNAFKLAFKKLISLRISDTV